MKNIILPLEVTAAKRSRHIFSVDEETYTHGSIIEAEGEIYEDVSDVLKSRIKVSLHLSGYPTHFSGLALGDVLNIQISARNAE